MSDVPKLKPHIGAGRHSDDFKERVDDQQKAGEELVKNEQCYLHWQWTQIKREGFAGRQQRDAAKGAAGHIWTGIGLSGGGIRSATYCLGALQCLAAHDLLRYFDYLSTVSGGGYLGASLRWWWTQKQNRSGVGPKDFPYGTKNPVRDQPIKIGETDFNQAVRLQYLRTHGNYLVPGDGINFWSALAVILRSLFLNLMVWASVATLLFLALLAFNTWLTPRLSWLPNPLPGLAIPAWEDANKNNPQSWPVSFAVMVWVSYFIAAAFALYSVGISIMSVSSHDTRERRSNWLLALGGLALVGLGAASIIYFHSDPNNATQARVVFNFAIGASSALLGLLILVGLAFDLANRESGKIRMDEAYAHRRRFERWFGWLFVKYIIFLALGIVPLIAALLWQWDPAGVGAISILAGVFATLRGHYAAVRKLSTGLADSIFLPLGAALLIFGVLIIAYQWATAIYDPWKFVGACSPSNSCFWLRSVAAAPLVLGILLTFVVNTNHTGLHRFYRDRLLEAYMPSKESTQSGVVGPSPVADKLKLVDVWPQDDGATNNTTDNLNALANVPYPIINTNVVLVNDKHRVTAIRGGDNYILTPLYCGSFATGWVRTQDPACRNMTLASATAASGAAVNSNSGYIGGGLTRNKLISTVMMLLNARLGYWVANPITKRPKMREPKRTQHWPVPNHLHPGLIYAISRSGYKYNSQYLELTDGGHFENLGLYELIRRRCQVILICDGEADKQTAYLAFVSAVRRIEEDFRATIEFIPNHGVERIVANQTMDYPADAKCSRFPYIVAKVNYADDSHGVILYLKAAITEEASFKVKGYKGANPDFPNETTADQFFDPVQFEAYRELGYRGAYAMIDGLGLNKTNIWDWEAIWEKAKSAST